jgi:dTDP-4-dehydrorhamnose reductase
MLSILGLEEKVAIREVGSQHFQDEYFAERPPSERLVNRKLVLRGLDNMRHWKTALAEYLATYYESYL